MPVLLEPVVHSAITIVVFLLMLGVLVVIHEVGHFVTARLANVRVLEFGIGFPPRAKVLSSDGETLYTLNWLPIGGFVKLEGEEGESDDPRSFVRASLPTKLAILVAGVAMNLLLAFAVFTAIAWLPGRVGALGFERVQPGSPAEEAGLTPTDRIVSVDGRVYLRDDDPFGDGFLEMLTDLRAKAGQTVTLGVLRVTGEERTVTVRLRSPDEIGPERGALGIEQLRFSLTDRELTRSPGEAIALGAEWTGEAFAFVLDGLGQLVRSIATSPTEAPPATGPIGIAVGVGNVFWQAGVVATIHLAAILSANLALVNILPFPPLDGGRVVMVILKRLVGERLSVRAEQLTYLVGFAFLFAFLIWITAFDIARLGGGVQ